MRIDIVSIRYGMAGLLVLAVDYALLNTLLFIGIGLVESASIGFIAGAGAGYLLHSKWTFRYETKGKHVIKFSQFIMTGAAGLIITDFTVYLCTTTLLLNHNISKTIAVAFSALWAYVASRWWIFKKNSKKHDNENGIRHFLVLAPYYVPHMGGLENHAHEFNEHMSKKGWNVTVWTAKLPRSSKHEEISENGVRIYRYDAYEVVAGFPIPAIWKRSFWKQWNTIRLNTYSHVISRTRFFLSSVMAYAIAQDMDIPHIHVEHGSYFVSQKNTYINIVAYMYDVTIGRFVLQVADRVIANSNATASFVRHITNGRVRPQEIGRASCRERV